MTDSGKCCCDRCRWDTLRQLEVKLQIALEETENLKRKNKGLEDQLRAAVAGCEDSRRDTARRQDGVAECLVLGESVIWNMKTEHVSVQCFPGIGTEQLKSVVESRELGI
jgi:hypothetical protein